MPSPMGRRIDALLLIGSVIFVLEFKVGEKEFTAQGLDGVWDWLVQNFTKPATSDTSPRFSSYRGKVRCACRCPDSQNDRLFHPVRTNVQPTRECH